jgi:hypothetical protein
MDVTEKAIEQKEEIELTEKKQTISSIALMKN